MFTVITEGNKVRQYHDIDYLTTVRMTEKDYLILRECGSLEGSSGNPITWPTDAKNGLQAIVDVKAGTLRFAYDGWPRAQTEFVVSEYVEPVTAPHIFDQVDNWPQQHRGCLGTMPLPECWEWKWFGDDWVLSNGTIGLVRDDWFKYKFGDEQVVAQPAVTAASMLTAALGHMEDRAKTYDAPGGERSMGKTVAAFNVITGLELTEEQGWLFMILLKAVRAQTDKTLDSLEDMVAYSALLGEAQSKRKNGEKSS